jgi:hypothetical protein
MTEAPRPRSLHESAVAMMRVVVFVHGAGLCPSVSASDVDLLARSLRDLESGFGQSGHSHRSSDSEDLGPFMQGFVHGLASLFDPHVGVGVGILKENFGKLFGAVDVFFQLEKDFLERSEGHCEFDVGKGDIRCKLPNGIEDDLLRGQVIDSVVAEGLVRCRSRSLRFVFRGSVSSMAGCQKRD